MSGYEDEDQEEQEDIKNVGELVIRKKLTQDEYNKLTPQMKQYYRDNKPEAVEGLILYTRGAYKKKNKNNPDNKLIASAINNGIKKMTIQTDKAITYIGTSGKPTNKNMSVGKITKELKIYSLE